MKFSLRDTQTDFAIHDISSSKLIHILLEKKAIDDSRVTTAVSKIADLGIGKSIKIKWYSVTRTE